MSCRRSIPTRQKSESPESQPTNTSVDQSPSSGRTDADKIADAVANLPGSHLWPSSSVLKGLGLPNQYALNAKLKLRYCDWRTALGVGERISVRGRKQSCIPSQLVRRRNNDAQNRRTDPNDAGSTYPNHLIYSPQALLGLVQLFNDNADSLKAALHQKFTRHVRRPVGYEDSRRNFQLAFIPALQEVDPKSTKSFVAILTTCEPQRWFSGTPTQKRDIVITTVIELCSFGFLDPKVFSLEDFSAVAPIEDIYANHFDFVVTGVERQPMDKELEQLITSERQTAYNKRQSLRLEFPKCFSPLALGSCEPRVLASLEYLLAFDLTGIASEVIDNSDRLGKALKAILISAFKGTGLASPLQKDTGTSHTETGLKVQDLVALVHHVDVRFNKHYQSSRHALDEAIIARRQVEKRKVTALCGLYPDSRTPLLDWLRERNAPRETMQANEIQTTPSRALQPQTEAPIPLSQRKAPTTSVLGGRPTEFTDEAMAYLRFLRFTCNLSQRSTPMALFAAGGYFCAETPQGSEVPSEVTIRYADIRLHLADRRSFALRLYATLKQFPYAKITFIYDGTPQDGTNRQSIFMRCPLMPEEDTKDKYPEHKCFFCAFPVSADKTALSQAEVVLTIITIIGSEVEGLTILILVAYMGETVDHAAIAQAKQLWKAADTKLTELLLLENKSLNDVAPQGVKRAALGDSYHKLAIPLNNGLLYGTFGQDRGGKGKGTVVGFVSQGLDIAFIQRKDQKAIQTRATAFMGRKVPLLPNVVKQRWEQEGAMAEVMMSLCALESSVHRGHYMLPHFFSTEMDLYTKSSYQYPLLARVVASGLNVFVHISMVFTREVHDLIWVPANDFDRKKNPRGSPHGMAMREHLWYIHYKLLPTMERAAIDPLAFFPKTRAVIDALPTYMNWTALVEDTSVPGGFVPLRIGVPLAMKLSIEATKQDPSLVKIGTGMFVDTRSMTLIDELSDYQSKVTKSELRMANSEGGVLSRDELKALKIEEMKVGALRMQKKFQSLYLEFYRPPNVIMFITVAGMAGAAMRWLVALVRRHHEALIPETERNSYQVPLMEKARDRFFAALFHEMSPPEAVAAEKDTVEWLESYCLFSDPDVRRDLAKLTHVLEEDRTKDTLVLSFAESFPNIHVRLGYTGDVKGQSNFTCEQSNRVLDKCTNVEESIVTQEVRVAYHYNIALKRNEKTCDLRSRAKVAVVKRKNWRATDTHMKRRAMVVEGKKEASVYTPEYMQDIPSRKELSMQGTRHFDRAHAGHVLLDAERRRGRRESITSEEKDALIESIMTKLSPRDEEQLTGGKGDGVYEKAIYALMNSRHWGNVPDEELSDEIKIAHPLFWQRFWLPHEFNISSNWHRGDLEPEEEHGTADDLQEGATICTCNVPFRLDRAIGEWRVVKCDGPSCRVRYYHHKCAGLKRKPNSNKNWFCSACKGDSATNKRKRRMMEFNEKLPVEMTLERSIVLHSRVKWHKNIHKRRDTPAFMRKQVRGFLAAIVAGRNRNMEPSRFFMGLDEEGSEVWMKAEKGCMADAWPKAECPFCRCRHAGGIRCFLTQEDDRCFVRACVRPYSHTLSLARKEEERAAAAAVLGEHQMSDDGYDPSRDHAESTGLVE